MPDFFDPAFDDREWTDVWRGVPVAQVPPGIHPSGYRVDQRFLTHAEIFGVVRRLTEPYDCRALYAPSGKLWMSSTPQEQIMMANNALVSRGHVLVGGLGLGLYPQYAERLGWARRITVVERSPDVCAIVEPVLRAALNIPLEILLSPIEEVLSGPVTTRYDTIFLDTWDTLDATQLPAINRLRSLAGRHLAPGGKVLLWGYGWMVSLFVSACRQLLMAENPAGQLALLAGDPNAFTLLAPAIAHFENQPIDDMDTALRWCADYISGVEEPEPPRDVLPLTAPPLGSLSAVAPSRPAL